VRCLLGNNYKSPHYYYFLNHNLFVYERICFIFLTQSSHDYPDHKNNQILLLLGPIGRFVQMNDVLQ